MIAESVFHFIPSIEKLYLWVTPHSARHEACQFVYCQFVIASHVKDFVQRSGNRYRFRDDRRNISNISERTSLLTVTVNRHRFALETLVHKDAHDVAVLVSNVLTFAVDVVWPEDYVIQVEHLVADFQFSLNSKFCNAVGVLRVADVVFAEWRFVRSVHRDARREHEALHFVIHRAVDEVHRANQIVLVIKSLDEVRETFGGIRSQMVHVIEWVLVEQTVQHLVIENRTFHKDGAVRYVLSEASTEIVQHNNFVSHLDQMLRDVASQKTRSSSTK